ncbi:MAG: YggS family pyridoxal phosphate-dependent enzyme [Candidatus Limnocylindria bacterium]
MRQPLLPTADEIRDRYERLSGRLRSVAEGAGRDPGRFRIVAVTKTWPVEVARGALQAGITILGENRVQEAEPKAAAIAEAEWHLVGRLQSNKARRAARAFAAIHSVDTVELLRRLDELAEIEGHAPRLLLQVNLTGEPDKGGFRPGAVSAVPLGELRHATVAGLMAMARHEADEVEARAMFAALRRLRDRLQETSGIGLPELSMGMSADAEAAVAEGATLVRIGTALFGPRGE